MPIRKNEKTAGADIGMRKYLNLLLLLPSNITIKSYHHVDATLYQPQLPNKKKLFGIVKINKNKFYFY